MEDQVAMFLCLRCSRPDHPYYIAGRVAEHEARHHDGEHCATYVLPLPRGRRASRRETAALRVQ